MIQFPLGLQRLWTPKPVATPAGPASPPVADLSPNPLERFESGFSRESAARVQAPVNEAARWLEGLPSPPPRRSQASVARPQANPTAPLLMMGEAQYSCENPPPAKVVGEKLYAIHATNYLPAGGVMKAACRDISGNGPEIGNEPPSFRPTLHFALGELVRSHGRSSWDESKFAIMMPLGALKDQLVNVNPYDTFVIGDVKLPAGAIVIVPEGQAVTGLPEGVKVVTYPEGMTIRQAVERQVEREDGWSVRMRDGGVSNEEKAMWEGQNINSPAFFSNFLGECRHAGFGSHVFSAQGEAFRLGGVEQAINGLCGEFRYSRGSTEGQRQLFRDIIDHHMTRLDAFTADMPEISRQSYQEKRTLLKGWLHLVDTDRQLSQTHGKTLRGSELEKELSALKLDPPGLQRFIEEKLPELPKARSEFRPVDAGLASSVLASMAPQELQQFCQSRPKGLEGVELAELFTRYSIQRSLLVGPEQSQAEGLPLLLQRSLGKVSSKESVVLDELEDHLSGNATTLPQTLAIMRLPEVRERLAVEGLKLPEGGPAGLGDVIRADPECQALFASAGPSLASPLDQVAMELLSKLGRTFPEQAEMPEDLKKARRAAYSQQWQREDLEEGLAGVKRPLNSVKHPDELRPGDRLGFYEQLRQNERDLIGKLGLKGFDSPEALFSSPRSLLDLYLSR